MIEPREADPDRVAAWEAEWKTFLEGWYSAYSIEPGWRDFQVQRRLGQRARSENHVFTLHAGDAEVGLLSLAVLSQMNTVMLCDLVIAPEHRHHGYARAALAWATDWAKQRQAGSLTVVADEGNAAHQALFRDLSVRAMNMIKRVSTVDDLPEGVAGRPMTEAEYAWWRPDREADYARQITEAGLLPEDKARVTAAEQFDQLLPEGVHTAGNELWCLDATGELAATLWLTHQYAPSTSFVYNVEVLGARRGSGYGRAAMLVAEEATAAAGNTQLGLNVFGWNTVAVGLYRKLGYATADMQRAVDL